MINSQPVRWWRLISEMEEFRARTGWGLAAAWAEVHGGNHDAAVRLFAEARETYRAAEHARHGPGSDLTESRAAALAARTTAGIGELSTLAEGMPAVFGGVLSDIERVETEDGDPYAVAVLSDRTGCIPITVPPSCYQVIGADVSGRRPVLVKGRTARADGEIRIVVTDLHVPDLDEPRPPTRRVRPLAGSERR